jgi:hypothetical protein
MLRRRGFDLSVVTSYEDAAAEFDRLAATTDGKPQDLPRVILDLLIPRSDTGTLDSIEVGFALARRACTLGVRQVVILTVVAKARVVGQYSKLEADFPMTSFAFLEKTMGNSAQLVNALVRALTPRADQEGALDER